MATDTRIIDVTQTRNSIYEAPQTKEQDDLAARVQVLFRGAFEAKDQIDLPLKWATFDDYIRNQMNEPLTPDQPGSRTNIIKPRIDAQISDLVDKPFAIQAKGREPGDHMYSVDVQHLLEFVFDKNSFITKLTQSERDRLELGTTVIKVYTDPEGLGGKSLPTFEIVSPANFFPDPKWTAARLLQECEFVIHAVPRPLSWIRKQFPKMGKYVQRQVSVPYDPTLQTENFDTDTVEVDTSQRALVIECYMTDPETGNKFCVHVANNIVLEDSRDLSKEKIQRRNLFPFVAIPCYTMRGTGWGQGDVELLIPTQDMINDLDDQIRLSARLMGSPQIVVGMGAGKGFDFRKWTNAAALRVPMRDHTAWQIVPGVPVSPDVVVRREKGFVEADMIAGTYNVNRGETPGGGVTAASAIAMLQREGQKTVLQKSKTWKEGWKLVLELIYDEVVTEWDEPMWIRINGNQPDFTMVDPSQFGRVPVMVPNLQPLEGEENIKPLYGDPTPMLNGEAPMMDEMGQPLMNEPQPMTREAEFDLELGIGDGLPTDIAFQYQMMTEWSAKIIEGKPLVSWLEMRNFIRDQLGVDLGDDNAIQAPMMPGQMPPGAGGMPSVPTPAG